MPATNKPSLPTNRAFVAQLHADAQVEQQEFTDRVEHIVSMRAAFINHVAAPIANKLFECGMLL